MRRVKAAYLSTNRLPLRILAVAVWLNGISQGENPGPHDPGPRQGPASGGAMIAGLTGVERELFRKGLEAFETINSVQGDAYVPQRRPDLGRRSI